MPATIVDANRKELEKKVDVGGWALNEALAGIAESLGSHGFRGSLRLQLTVTVEDDMYGEHVTLERTTNLKFKR